MILPLPRVSPLLFGSSVFPVYYTVLSFVLHARRPLMRCAVTHRARARPHRGGHLRRARRRGGDRRHVVAAAGLGRPPLTRGVGDTWFLAADGRPGSGWTSSGTTCRSTDIPPDLQHAFVAVEDHRFYRIRASIRSRSGARSCATCARRARSKAAARSRSSSRARSSCRTRRPTGAKPRSGARADDRGAAHQGADPRAVSESHLPQRAASTASRRCRGICSDGRRSAEPRRVRAHRRAGARAVGAVAVVEPRRRASSAATSCWRGCARRASSRRRRSGRRVADEPAHPAVSRQPSDARGGYAKEFLRQQFRDRFGGDHPPDWQVQHDVRARAAGRGGARGARRASRGSTPRTSQAALVAIDPRTGDILAMVGGRDFRAVAVQPRRAAAAASRARRSSRSCTPRRSSTATRRCRVLDGPAHASRRRGRTSGRRATPSGETPDALTLRAALIESNNRAATALQQRIGSRPVLRLASRRRPSRPARRAVARRSAPGS